jgi:hypothetical protein
MEEVGRTTVVIVGFAFCTARGSQAEVAGLLLVSPEYVALKL